MFHENGSLLTLRTFVFPCQPPRRDVPFMKQDASSIVLTPNEHIRVPTDHQHVWVIREWSAYVCGSRREVAVAIDFYRYDILSTDRESFLRLALHGDVLLIKKVYGVWVQHGSNFSQKIDFETRKMEITITFATADLFLLILGIDNVLAILCLAEEKLNPYLYAEFS